VHLNNLNAPVLNVLNWLRPTTGNFPHSNADIMNVELYITPHTFKAWCLIKHRFNFAFTFYTDRAGSIL